MPNLNAISAPISQPIRTEAPKAPAAAPQTEAQTALSKEKLTVSEAGQRGQAATAVTFGDRFGTASKFGLTAMLGGVVIGAIQGARTGAQGGGDMAMIGVVLGGAYGAIKGGALGLAGGGVAGLAYSYATEKNHPETSAAPSADGKAVTDAKGIDTDKPVSKGSNLFGDIAKGAVTGTVGGVVTGAVIGGIKGGSHGGGNFPMIGVFLGGLQGALVGGGVGLVGGGVTGAVIHAKKN